MSSPVDELVVIFSLLLLLLFYNHMYMENNKSTIGGTGWMKIVMYHNADANANTLHLHGVGCVFDA
jgi:hypothetical protein